jgi:hypothetical protein
MLTLSTIPAALSGRRPQRGFRLFVDGRLRAELSGSASGDDDGTTNGSDGGAAAGSDAQAGGADSPSADGAGADANGSSGGRSGGAGAGGRGAGGRNGGGRRLTQQGGAGEQGDNGTAIANDNSTVSAAGGPGDTPRRPGRPRPVPVTGGDPMDLSSGHLVLCGRSDRDPQRFYSGLISNLALFDEVTRLTSHAHHVLYWGRPMRQAVSTA